MSTEGQASETAARWADRSFLRNVQYADASNFAARQAIYRFQQPRIAVYDWALDLARLTGDETILDVGCGNGGYLRALHRRGHAGLVVGMDFSPGMLASSRDAAGDESSQPLVQGDAAQLPFASGSIDAALAMHMLYHVPDRAQALSELRRVVAPEGVVLIVLNGAQHNAQLNALVRAALVGLGLPVPASTTMGSSLDLDRGALLAAEQFSVERHEVSAELVVTEAEPVVDYVRSMSFVRKGLDAEGALLGEVRDRVAAIIASDGAVRISTAMGCLVCR
jgi:ubiquinone/menaquinone biosynthesis C-methylase UbiE